MFAKDSRTENFLTQLGVDFRYSNAISFTDLVVTWKKENIARPVAVRDQAVLEYAALTEGGSPGPAVILAGPKPFRVLDGVQRLCAEELVGSTEFSAYLVSTDSTHMIEKIRVFANIRMQGHAEPPEFTRRNAVEVLILKGGLSVDEVARLGGWRPTEITETAQLIEMGNLVESLGAPELPFSVLKVVRAHANAEQLSEAPEQTASFLSTIKACRLSATDADEHVATFFAPTARKDKTTVYKKRLQEFQESHDIVVRSKGRRAGVREPVELSLSKTLKAAETHAAEMAAKGYCPQCIDQYFHILNQIRSHLHSLCPKHAKAVTAETPADMWK